MIQPEETNSSYSGEPETSHDETIPPYLKKQTSAMAGGHDDGRLPPRGRITAVAAGGGGGGRSTPLKAGQNVICKIINAAPNGYNVFLVDHNLEGFIQGNFDCQPGELKLAQFVCIHQKRALLSMLMAKK